MNFSRQAASFMRAGIPILDSLAIVAEESTAKELKKVLNDIQQRLRAGSSFGDAIAQHPRVFPGYYIAVIRASELTGQLDDAFEQLAAYMQRDINAQRQVKSSLTYPSFVFVLAIAAVIVMAVYVLPKFKGFYKSLGAHLPLPDPHAARLHRLHGRAAGCSSSLGSASARRRRIRAPRRRARQAAARPHDAEAARDRPARSS